MPRSVQALGLSVLLQSLKASVAVELELGCMTPAATSSSLLLPSLFCCWRRYKFSARPPVLFFLFLFLFFFLFFLLVVQTHERSAWMSHCGGVRGTDKGMQKMEETIKCQEEACGEV